MYSVCVFKPYGAHQDSVFINRAKGFKLFSNDYDISEQDS